MNRSFDWLKQAINDLKWARDSLGSGHFGGVCFLSQQVAEKALKSIAYFQGADLVKGHSVREITKSLNINGELLKAANKLDQYYITSRYPDAVPSGAPFEFFEKEQGEEAIELAKLFIDAAIELTGWKDHE